MKTIRLYNLWICLIALLALSCSQREGLDGSCGYLTIGLESEVEGDILVRSAEDESELDPMIYRIQVVDAEDNVDADILDHTTVTEENPIKLLMGKYTVKASNGEPETGFNKPYWYGDGNVRIYAEKSSSVSITCKMEKVILSVAFPTDAEFQSMFSEYSLIVRAGSGEGAETLTFSSTAAEGQGAFSDVAYFVVPEDRTLTYTLVMKNIDGAEYSSTSVIEQVKAAEHYHLDFKLGEKEEIDGALVLNITVDGEYREQRVHHLNLNFDKTLLPSYTTNPEFTPEDEGIVYPLGNSTLKKFTFSAPRGIKNLTVTHLDYNLLLAGLPQLTDFMNITDQARAAMSQLGIYATISGDGLTAEIDITEFIKNLGISPENTRYAMAVTVVDTYDRYARCDMDFAVISDIEAETVSEFHWSGFAILKGKYFKANPPAGMSFQYKRASDAEWTDIDPSSMVVDTETMTYTYTLRGLTPNTEYVFRATSDVDKEAGKSAAEMSFTTFATEETVYNLSFDDWVESNSAWYPSSDLNVHYVWDSANGGTASLGGVPTTPETSNVVSGKAARMESQKVFGKFAAGNIYTGKFGKATLSPVGATLDWGLEFSSRPLALRGWYRYEPKPIDMTSSKYSHLSGQTDNCQIQIFLTDWTSPFTISTGDERFVDTSEGNKSILAYGTILSNDNTTDNGGKNGYVQFTIPLEYRSLKQPTYIVISAAASRYGDYFTGGLGSVLYLDELELIYDPAQLTAEELNIVLGRVR